jgi:hypothetical protein
LFQMKAPFSIEKDKYWNYKTLLFLIDSSGSYSCEYYVMYDYFSALMEMLMIRKVAANPLTIWTEWLQDSSLGG